MANQTAKQPVRSVTVAKLSARPNIPYSPDLGIASSVFKFDLDNSGHLLADYPVNGSGQIKNGVNAAFRNIRFVYNAVAHRCLHYYVETVALWNLVAHMRKV
ncbi:MAG: hypothetical protein WDN50_07250 [Bradyrhizobium sp.]